MLDFLSMNVPWRRWILGALATTLLFCGTACQSDTTASEADAAGILTLLEAYLPRLALSYSTGDPSVLEGYAAEKEIAGLRKRIRDLDRESREIKPTFHSVKLESAQVWSYANAFATTLELWDLQVVVAGTRTVLSEVEGQRSRVKYQLKRSDDSWVVLFREIETVFE